MIEIVSPVLVDRVWPQIREGMQEACRRGGNQYSEAWLHTACRKGDAYLLLLHDGDMEPIRMAVVAQEQMWVGRQVFFVWATTGHDIEDWWLPVVEWAAANFPGCKDFIFEGRPGWAKLPGVKVLRHIFEMSMNGHEP